MNLEPLTKESSTRICNHMNKDHGDAVIAYAKYYGGIEICNKAEIVHLSSELMELKVDEQIIKVKFDHTLTDCSDAHRTLVSMIKSIPKAWIFIDIS